MCQTITPYNLTNTKITFVKYLNFFFSILVIFWVFNVVLWTCSWAAKLHISSVLSYFIVSKNSYFSEEKVLQFDHANDFERCFCSKLLPLSWKLSLYLTYTQFCAEYFLCILKFVWFKFELQIQSNSRSSKFKHAIYPQTVYLFCNTRFIPTI